MTRDVRIYGFTLLASLAMFGCNNGRGGDDKGASAGDASGGTGSDSDDSDTEPDDLPPPAECGVPGTSQVRRLTNAEYDAVLRDLLGVETLSNGSKPSSLLVPDFDGSLTDIAWNGYLVAAESVARDVVGGVNRANFITCDPSAAGCIDETIRTFGRKAFRRPLTAEEAERFQVFTTLEPAGTPDEIAEAILFAFLASPSFLTVPELGQDKLADGTTYALTSYEVAARLSFLLWGTTPDAELSAAADADALRTKDQILAQAERLVQNREKVGPIVAAIHRAYADIRLGSHWATLDHNPQLYPEYTPDALPALMQEIDRFFEDVAFDGGSFKDLFLSSVAYVNQDTAALYGLDPVGYGPELTRVVLDAEQRPGFLTRAAFLSSFSRYETTSPILRGAYIVRDILGVDPGVPDPDALNATAPERDYQTYREYVEALTSPAACSSCHTPLVNPPGFVLEWYDSVGAWQEIDPLGGAISGVANVNFGNGNVKEIKSPLELMTEIGTGDGARRNYAQKVVIHTTGRRPNPSDACIVDDLAVNLSEDGYTVLDVLVDLTQADSFRLRTIEN